MHQFTKVEKTDKLYQDILEIVSKLQTEVSELRTENAILKNRIHELEHPKNSNNSSIPPSKDENRPKKNQSLRKKSGKSTGGQKGHKGHTLEIVENPDKIIDHLPDICTECGKSLSAHVSTHVIKRQIIKMPEIHPTCTEHRSHSKVCACGHINKATFPTGVNSPIQYGDNIENLVAYLNVGQYIPYNRIASLFNSLFNIPLSQGSIKNMLDRFTEKSLPVYGKIRQIIESSNVAGTDETGAKMNGEKWWFWTWQNLHNTYIAASDNRGYRTIEEHFPIGFKYATLVSDRYGAQLKTTAGAHQICLSHLLRDLDYLIELTDSERIKRFRLLLYDALDLKKQMKEQDFPLPNVTRNRIRKKTFDLLDENINDDHKKVKSLIKKLKKSRNYIYQFLYEYHVPPDNNGSERAIRNVKVKQKVSTMFKTKQGIKNYAIIRSIFDTCNKRGISMFESHKLALGL